MKTPQEDTREDVLEAKKAANAVNSSQPALTAAEVSELADLQSR